MNLRETTQVAAQISARADTIITCPHPLPVHALHAYWKISRTRLKHWIIGFESASAREWSISPTPGRLTTRELGRQILTAELLTRVWTVVLVARDNHQGRRESAAIARRVFVGHQQARQQVLAWLVRSPASLESYVAPVDHVRRRVEYLSDFLISPIAECCDLGEFAFDEQRVRQFAKMSQLNQSRGHRQGDALDDRLRVSVRDVDDPNETRSLLERGLLRSIRAMLPGEPSENREPVRSPGTPRFHFSRLYRDRTTGEPAPSGDATSNPDEC